MAGPLPKDPSQRRRRNATPGFEQLPPEGRVAPAPEWPFPPASKQETAKWEDLWRLPQAVKWEEMHAEDTVALYVRTLIAAVEDIDNTKLLAEVRQLDAKLGISPKAMLNIRWTIAPRTEVVEIESAPSNGKSARAFIPKKE